MKVTVVDETDRTDVIVRPGTKPPRIESIGFPTGLQSVCLYFRGTNRGKVPVKVMMDGQDVTTLSRIASDPRLDMSPMVVKLRAPLARGSFHCFQGIYADGSRATAGIRAFDDEMGYGLWGARPGSEAEPNIGQEHVLDMGVHNINVQMPTLGSGAAASALVLVAVGEELADVEPGEIQRRVEQSLVEQQQTGFEPVVAETTSRHVRRLNGHPVVFEVIEGRGATSGKPRVEARGILPGRFGLVMTPPNPTATRPPELKPLPGKSGPVLLLFNADPKTFAKSKLVEVIDSIALPGQAKR